MLKLCSIQCEQKELQKMWNWTVESRLRGRLWRLCSIQREYSSHVKCFYDVPMDLNNENSLFSHAKGNLWCLVNFIQFFAEFTTNDDTLRGAEMTAIITWQHSDRMKLLWFTKLRHRSEKLWNKNKMTKLRWSRSDEVCSSMWLMCFGRHHTMSENECK